MRRRKFQTPRTRRKTPTRAGPETAWKTLRLESRKNRPSPMSQDGSGREAAGLDGREDGAREGIRLGRALGCAGGGCRWCRRQDLRRAEPGCKRGSWCRRTCRLGLPRTRRVEGRPMWVEA